MKKAYISCKLLFDKHLLYYSLDVYDCRTGCEAI